MVGSSIALSISDIPFAGPTGSVVVGLIDGEFVINPTVTQMEKSDLDLTVAGTRDAVMMVEAGAKEVSEEKMLEAILFGHEEIKKIVEFIDTIVEAVGKEKQEIEFDEPDEQVVADVKEMGYDILAEGLKPFDRYERKAAQEEAEGKLKGILLEKYGEEEFDAKEKDIDDAIYNLTKKNSEKQDIKRRRAPRWQKS